MQEYLWERRTDRLSDSEFSSLIPLRKLDPEADTALRNCHVAVISDMPLPDFACAYTEKLLTLPACVI